MSNHLLSIWKKMDMHRQEKDHGLTACGLLASQRKRKTTSHNAHGLVIDERECERHEFIYNSPAQEALLYAVLATNRRSVNAVEKASAVIML
ncbi:hypothetical protein EDM57_12635 [Brevibacillus gelatini]|uniref:Uncharacterized protein n=1 Tax=Brevibacillus gelatini TaxID=1655277 RepID=A0A3M8B0B0_9BACL|nr:hypothetical protein EDM57_12635 [Brevibacillus gelatini]